MRANPSASTAPPLPSSGLSYLSMSSIHGSPCTYRCNARVRGISGYCFKLTRYGCTPVALLGRVRMLLNTSARTSKCRLDPDMPLNISTVPALQLPPSAQPVNLPMGSVWQCTTTVCPLTCSSMKKHRGTPNPCPYVWPTGCHTDTLAHRVTTW